MGQRSYATERGGECLAARLNRTWRYHGQASRVRQNKRKEPQKAARPNNAARCATVENGIFQRLRSKDLRRPFLRRAPSSSALSPNPAISFVPSGGASRLWALATRLRARRLPGLSGAAPGPSSSTLCISRLRTPPGSGETVRARPYHRFRDAHDRRNDCPPFSGGRRQTATPIAHRLKQTSPRQCQLVAPFLVVDTR